MSAGLTTAPRRRHRPPAWQVGTAVAVLAAYAAGLLWYGDTQHSFDLRIYYHAVAWWADGRPLYDYAQPDKVQGSLSFTYPPFAALLMMPMLAAGLSATVAAFWLFDAVAAAVIVVWLVTPVAARYGWPRWFALCLAVPVAWGLEPLRETATYGQINLLLAVLLLADLLFAVPRPHGPSGSVRLPPHHDPERWSRLAGVGVGVAAAIKLTPAIFVLYLLLTRRFRAAVTAMAAFAVATGVGALYRPGDTWRFFTGVLWDTGRVGHADRVSNQSVMGALARLWAPHRPNGVLWLVLVLAVAAYGLYRAVRAARAGDELTGVTLTGITGALASPISWHHHLYWFAPALLILVDAAAGDRRHRVRWVTLAVVLWATVTFGLIEVYDYHLLHHRDLDSPPGQLLADWYVLLMLALLVLLPVRRLPPGEPPAAWRAPRQRPAPAGADAGGAGGTSVRPG